jgi:hypothetical protein
MQSVTISLSHQRLWVHDRFAACWIQFVHLDDRSVASALLPVPSSFRGDFHSHHLSIPGTCTSVATLQGMLYRCSVSEQPPLKIPFVLFGVSTVSQLPHKIKPPTLLCQSVCGSMLPVLRVISRSLPSYQTADTTVMQPEKIVGGDVTLCKDYVVCQRIELINTGSSALDIVDCEIR